MNVERDTLDLAYVSPLNPTPSGLSDYSETLLPALSELARITLYTDSDMPSNPWITKHLPVRRVEDLARYHLQHDLRLYQLGNSAQHARAFDSLRRYPGVVTLHEPFLHTGLRGVSAVSYQREMYYELGLAGAEDVRHLAGEIRFEHLIHRRLIGRVVDLSLGFIVHSHTARRAIEAYGGATQPGYAAHLHDNIAVIAQPMPLVAAYDRRTCRAEWGLPEEALVFGAAGLIDPSKEPELLIEAFAQVRADLPQVWLMFAGELPPWYTRLPELAQSLGVQDRVVFLGRLEPLERLHRAMAACDVIVNLRRPTIGETSATALRALALGRPLIVRDVGWYGELPADACLKIAADGGPNDMVGVMHELGQNADLRARMSEAARRYIQTECDVTTAARRYTEYLQAIYERIAFARGQR